MRQLKHSKLKNTGLIYELLVRQVASDTMSNENSNALQIIKRHFGKDSQLAQELKLYRTLQEEVFNSNNKSIKFIEALISARKQLNETLLKKEKYNLIIKNFLNHELIIIKYMLQHIKFSNMQKQMILKIILKINSF
jgi:hypothetical protein